LQNELKSGLVVREMSGFFWVEAEDGNIYRCKLRGRLLEEAQVSDVAAIGDRVQFVLIENDQTGDGIIESVKERRGVFARGARTEGARGSGEAVREHVMIANPDAAFIVSAVAQPAPDWAVIDRLLVIADQANIDEVTLVVNKIDVTGLAEAQSIFGHYAQMGYHVAYVSAKDDFGIEELRERMTDRTSVFAGASGVGKSSLLNVIQPGLGRSTKEVSNWNDEGMHTTRDSILVKLDFGGYLADTPGMRTVQLFDIEPEELDGYFRDISQYVGRCKFNDCTHNAEPGCAVRTAVKSGQINKGRWRSYRAIWDELYAALEVY
jgi:ribosome biogenesis GTPase